MREKLQKITSKIGFDETKYVLGYIEKIFTTGLRVLISLGLLMGGLILLGLRIAGWSLIFGLPMVVFGAVFVIYTYDEVLSRHTHYYNDQDSA